MLSLKHHPNAFLTKKRNVHPGLVARTKIMYLLEKNEYETKRISKETGLNYSIVLYHLHLLEQEKILKHIGQRSYIWKLTGGGQQRLVKLIID